MMKPVGTPVDGHCSEIKKETPWLAWEDLDGKGDIEVTIDGVYHYKDVVMQDGRNVEDLYTLRFKNRKKELVLNATNRKNLVEKFGVHLDKWIGKPITLWVDQNVRFVGEKTKGIRIR